jgi:SAM-dependent methyltransferase
VYLARYGIPEGVDLDEEAIEYCHARGLDRVQRARAEHLPFADDSFDLVTALDVIEHTDDDLLVLREMARILRPNGHLLVAVPAYKALWGRQDEISAHRRRYVASQLRERLKAAGFAIKRLTYFNSVLFPAIASVRLIKRVLPPERDLKSDFTVPAPGPVNGLLAGIFGAERFALERFDLPFGVSLMALAAKPAKAS